MGLEAKILGIFASIIIAPLLIYSVYAFFHTMANEAKINNQATQIDNLSKELEVAKHNEKVALEVKEAQDKALEAKENTENDIYDLKKDNAEKQKTINKLIDKVKAKEVSGEYDYSTCPNTENDIDLINTILGKKDA